jgi:hypothetical protein
MTSPLIGGLRQPQSTPTQIRLSRLELILMMAIAASKAAASPNLG